MHAHGRMLPLRRAPRQAPATARRGQLNGPAYFARGRFDLAELRAGREEAAAGFRLELPVALRACRGAGAGFFFFTGGGNRGPSGAPSPKAR